MTRAQTVHGGRCDRIEKCDKNLPWQSKSESAGTARRARRADDVKKREYEIQRPRRREHSAKSETEKDDWIICELLHGKRAVAPRQPERMKYRRPRVELGAEQRPLPIVGEGRHAASEPWPDR